MKKGKKKQMKFIATIEENKIEAVDKIAKLLKDDGVKVNQVLTFSGIITGSTQSLDDINKFKDFGIKTVEEDKGKHAW